MKAIKTEKYNTCNDWGFGGSAGIETTYDNGLSTRKGKSYYRHHRPHQYFGLYIEFEGELIEVYDVNTEKKFKSVKAVSVYKNETALTARIGDTDEVEIGYHGMAKRVHIVIINH